MTAGSKAGVWTKAAEIDKLVAGLGNRPGMPNFKWLFVKKAAAKLLGLGLILLG